MAETKIPYIIGAILLVVLVIIVVSLGFFDGWVFFGMIFYIALFIGGYFYIMTGWQKDRETEEYENQRKQKFDWCFKKVNEALRRMSGGTGIEWDSGFGRVSDFKTFNDGTQNKPFRSFLSYLSGSQQIVLIIYDVDNDDIVKFDANPAPEVFSNHFHNFNPFKRSDSSGLGMSRFRTDRYGRRVQGAPRRMSIHLNDDDGGVDDSERSSYEDLKTKPDSTAVDDAYKRLNK